MTGRFPLLMMGVGAILWVALAGCQQAATSPTPSIPVVNQEQLQAELAKANGEVVVLNFWATWCVPCIEEMPYFGRLVEEYGGRGVRVLAVSFDDVDTLDTRVRPFVERNGYPLSFYIKAKTPGSEYEAFIDAFDPRWRGNVPATFIYDREGVRRAAFHGALTYNELVEAVRPHL